MAAQRELLQTMELHLEEQMDHLEEQMRELEAMEGEEMETSDPNVNELERQPARRLSLQEEEARPPQEELREPSTFALLLREARSSEGRRRLASVATRVARQAAVLAVAFVSAASALDSCSDRWGLQSGLAGTLTAMVVAGTAAHAGKFGGDRRAATSRSGATSSTTVAGALSAGGATLVSSPLLARAMVRVSEGQCHGGELVAAGAVVVAQASSLYAAKLLHRASLREARRVA